MHQRNTSLRTPTIAASGAIAALLLGAGCAASPDATTGGDGPTQTASALEAGMDTAGIAGNLRLFLTDAPADYDAVWVTTSRVEVSTVATDTGEETWVALADQPQTVDLLALRDDVTTVLGDSLLVPATYGQLRLIVDAASVVVDGVEQPLTIPSGAQTGVKIDLDLTVEADQVYALVLDFDADRSVHQNGHGEWMMSPTIGVEYVGEVEPDGTLTETETPPLE